MKILLIHPYVSATNPNTLLTEPLGLLYLASYLEREGYDVDILDLYALGINNIKRRGKLYRRGISNESSVIKLINKYRPDVIGISCNFTEYTADTFGLARLIKGNLKDITLILGGAHVTMAAEDTLGECGEAVDVVVRGEGEVTLKEVLDAIKNNNPFDSIAGITYRDKHGKIISSPRRALIKDLDTLPIPDRNKIPMEIYLKSNSATLPFSRRKPVATIMTSRGCPFDCVFCSTKVVWERKWRPVSPERVIEEIGILSQNYGVNEIAIYDDQFMVDRERIEKICDLLVERKYNIPLTIPPGTSVWLADEKLLRKMKEAGFYRLCFPIETGNKKTMKFIKKPVDLVRAKETIKIANKLGFWTQGNFIIGFPYETKAEILSTIKYAYNSGLDYAFFKIAKPYAGSEMYEIFEKEGLLRKIAKGTDVESVMYDTKTMKAKELQIIRDKASSRYLPWKILFYINPFNFCHYLLPKISSKEDIKYFFRIFLEIFRTAFKSVMTARKRFKILHSS